MTTGYFDSFKKVKLKYNLAHYLVDNLPNCAEAKHLQILCDGEEITSDSYVDLVDFIRQGYDLRCQLRPHSSIVHGPVMVEIHDSRELVLNLFKLLLQPASYQVSASLYLSHLYYSL